MPSRMDDKILGCEETASAFKAMVWPGACVGLDVPCHLRPGDKSLATMLALVRPLVTVQLSVKHKVRTANISTFTLITFVGSLSIVPTNMNHKIFHGEKTLLAFVTWELFFPRVCLAVPGKLSGRDECLRAMLTGIRLLTGMKPLVLLEVGGSQVRLTAYVTDVRPLPCVTAHVDPEISRHMKTLLTFIALVGADIGVYFEMSCQLS